MTEKKDTSEEKLQTARKRSFAVAIQSKVGLKPSLAQAIFVQAYSVDEAKNDAIKRVRKGPFKNRTKEMWEFPSVEEVT